MGVLTGRAAHSSDATWPAGAAKEIAAVVAFLASWHAQWVTGEVILASGGLRP
jgi:NAD(P)-dependent dehydrogenase (short-subunit alcohol dehydrogenase family)